MVVAAVVALIGILAYLRDPPWLIHLTSGLAAWRSDASGMRYRPMGGRASFFVPAEAATVTLPVRARFHSTEDWPITATFSVDGRPVERLVLTDGNWRTVTIQIRRASRRRVRRIDIHADRTRQWNYYALDVGAVEVR